MVGIQLAGGEAPAAQCKGVPPFKLFVCMATGAAVKIASRISGEAAGWQRLAPQTFSRFAALWTTLWLFPTIAS